MAKKKEQTKSAFLKAVEQALESVNDPLKLGKRSPLATTYFLGSYLKDVPDPTTAMGRGLALQKMLRTVAQDALWHGALPSDNKGRIDTEQLEKLIWQEEDAKGKKGSRYDWLILDLKYFRQAYQPATLRMCWEDILHISRTHFYRHVTVAVRHFHDALLERLQPTFLSEKPPRVGALFGRNHPLSQGHQALQAKKTILITGASGVGKTALATHLAAQFAPNATFWYTIRPDLNDNLTTFLFSLGAFLYSHGANGLWQQLLATPDRSIDPQLALGLIHHDLQSVESKIVLCIDEVDLLQPIDDAQERLGYEPMRLFLDSLRHLFPLIFVGQRAILLGDLPIELHGLTSDYLALLLADQAIPFSQQDLIQLHTMTGGNPRLLHLCIALCKMTHRQLDIVLTQLPQTPTSLAIFQRIWRRLTTEQRTLLQAIAVFHAAAPIDAWESVTETLDTLNRMGLLQRDAYGGVVVLPALRLWVYGRLSAENREQYHLLAAHIREERGEFTAAAHHLWKAGELDKAILRWYPHLDREIRHGHAAAALNIFEQISLDRLQAGTKSQLVLIRSKLYELMGQMEEVKTETEKINWSPDDPDAIKVLTLQARAALELGHIDDALNQYQETISLTHRQLESSLVHLHVWRGITYIRQRALDAGWREAELAAYEVEGLYGMLYNARDDYKTSRKHYLQALTIAKDAHYEEGVAQTNGELATLAARHAQFQVATVHFQQALAFNQKIGNQLKIAILYSQWSAMHLQAKQFDAAIEKAKRALAFFERTKNTFSIAVCASNLAEAYYKLQDYESAELYIAKAIAQEETQSMPYALWILGNVRLQQGNKTDAAQQLSLAHNMAIENKDVFVQAYILRSLGELYTRQDKLQDSLDAFRQAAILFERLGMATELAETQAKAKTL